MLGAALESAACPAEAGPPGNYPKHSQTITSGEHLRKRNKRSYVVANKIDNIDPEMARAEFSPMGLGDAIPIAGAHGRGIRSL